MRFILGLVPQGFFYKPHARGSPVDCQEFNWHLHLGVEPVKNQSDNLHLMYELQVSRLT